MQGDDLEAFVASTMGSSVEYHLLMALFSEPERDRWAQSTLNDTIETESSGPGLAVPGSILVNGPFSSEHFGDQR